MFNCKKENNIQKIEGEELCYVIKFAQCVGKVLF